MTRRTLTMQARKTPPTLANGSIIPRWGPSLGRTGCGATTEIRNKASGNGSKIGTEVVYDSRIAVAADRVGCPDRSSNHPPHLSQYAYHARGRSTFPRRIRVTNGTGTVRTDGQGEQDHSPGQNTGSYLRSYDPGHRRLGGLSRIERCPTLNRRHTVDDRGFLRSSDFDFVWRAQG